VFSMVLLHIPLFFVCSVLSTIDVRFNFLSVRL
jgi:hypothetical protein